MWMQRWLHHGQHRRLLQFVLYIILELRKITWVEIIHFLLVTICGKSLNFCGKPKYCDNLIWQPLRKYLDKNGMVFKTFSWNAVTFINTWPWLSSKKLQYAIKRRENKHHSQNCKHYLPVFFGFFTFQGLKSCLSSQYSAFFGRILIEYLARNFQSFQGFSRSWQDEQYFVFK